MDTNKNQRGGSIGFERKDSVPETLGPLGPLLGFQIDLGFVGLIWSFSPLAALLVFLATTRLLPPSNYVKVFIDGAIPRRCG